ncbi:MAG: cytochrome bd-type quinol oxidase subunit 1, partial [Paraglaciecola sp.]
PAPMRGAIVANHPPFAQCYSQLDRFVGSIFQKIKINETKVCFFFVIFLLCYFVFLLAKFHLKLKKTHAYRYASEGLTACKGVRPQMNIP